MNFVRRLMLSVFLFAGGGFCAQAQNFGATDNELYAAYCKGAVSMLDQGNIEVQRMTRRFSAYLFATGVMTDLWRREALLRLGAAMAHGQTDQQQCSATLLACNDAVDNAIHKKPGTPAVKVDPGLQLLACIEHNPSCPRAARCNGSDALPF